MAIESSASTSEIPCQQARQQRVLFISPERRRRTISPTERWLLIRDKAYVRVQRRGFVGGNPLTDWLDAEKEIDAKYVAGDRDASLHTDSAEITEQVKNAFAGYGLDDLGVVALLEKHRDGVEKLASGSSAC